MLDDLGRTSTEHLVGASCAPPHLRSTIVLMRRYEEVHNASLEDWDGRRWRTTVEYAIEEISRPAGATARDLANLINANAMDSHSAVVDIGRIGVEFAQLLTARRIVRVRLTDQAKLQRRRGLMDVPRHDVLGRLSVAGGDGRVTVEAAGGEVLQRALASFVPEDRGGELEDLVHATALACWWSESRIGPLTRQPRPPREASPTPKPLTFDQALELSKRARTTRTRI
jgi:hypothetical protein